MKKKIIWLVVIVVLISALTLLWIKGPRIIGFSKGHFIIYTQYCSDYCPGYGNTPASYQKYGVKTYLGINTEGECARINGKPIYIYGWGKQFVGCSPE